MVATSAAVRQPKGTVLMADHGPDVIIKSAGSTSRRAGVASRVADSRSVGLSGLFGVEEAPAEWAEARSIPQRRRGREGGGGWLYHIPQPYQELLNHGRATGPFDSEADSTTDDVKPLSVREFWRSAKELTDSRMEDLGSDAKPWQVRAARYHESLWLEELSRALELRKLRMTADEVPCVGDGLYSLNVTEFGDRMAALVDERGLMRGISLLVKCSRGYAYSANLQAGGNAGHLLLAAPAALSDARGPFEVEFRVHRFQQISMHRALDSQQGEAVLRVTTLPDKDTPALEIGPSKSEVADSMPASLNEGQRRAVAAALTWSSEHPLVIWGPPGTGKSTLAAFIVWHLVQQGAGEQCMLAVAPSNTGADVLCRKLAKLGLDPARMLRLNAVGRSVSVVPEDVQPYCVYGRRDDGRPAFVVPPIGKLREYRVVVATCICAAHISNALRAEGSADGWFSHVVVDEAGEATEPEALVALALLRRVGARSVLLGDHFQLGPLVVSQLAARVGGLETSTIERLAKGRLLAASTSTAGDEGGGGLSRDSLAACERHGLHFLTESYRSHKAITSMFSNIFYADQLEHRERAPQHNLMSFFESKGLSVPVLLHHTVGREERDPGSPSLRNVQELRVVQQYLTELMGDPALKVSAEEVGIITPYTSQLRAFEEQIQNLGSAFQGVECGTVERFQGQERRVVLMSTVRCSQAAGDTRQPIGFLADPRRLNVAISRAVAGLIIVGDFRTLAANSAHWRSLLSMSQEMGALRGEPLEEADARAVQSGAGDRAPHGSTASPATIPQADASAAWDALTG